MIWNSNTIGGFFNSKDIEKEVYESSLVQLYSIDSIGDGYFTKKKTIVNIEFIFTSLLKNIYNSEIDNVWSFF